MWFYAYVKSLRVIEQSYRTVFSCGAARWLYEVAVTFEYLDEIFKCNHSNESYCAVLSGGAVYYIVQSGSHF